VFRDGDQDIQLMHAVVDARVSEPEPRPELDSSTYQEIGNVHLDAVRAAPHRFAAQLVLEGLLPGQLHAIQDDLGLKRRGRSKQDKMKIILDATHPRPEGDPNANPFAGIAEGMQKLHDEVFGPELDKPGIDSAGFVTSAMNAHSLRRGDRVVIQGVPASVVGTSRHNAIVTLTLDDGRVLNLGLNEPVRRVHGGNLRKAAVPDDGPGDADPKAQEPVAAPDTRWPGWLLDMAIASVVASAILGAMPGLPIGELVSLFRRLARDWPKDLPTWREMDPQARRGTVERVLWELRQDGWPVRMADVLRDPILGAHLEGHFVGQQVGQAVADATLDGLDITSPDAALRLSINWSDWTPGHPEAARLLIEPGGLERLLRESNVVINRLAAGRLDQIGRIIGEGLADGLSPREIAGRLRALVNDPDWAMMTAVTETNRAMSAASVMQYREAGLLFKGWMTAFDQRVCKICDHNAHHEDGRPRIVPIDELFPSGDPWPPGHPRCRCAPIPVLNSMVPTPSAREAQT
jgi:SPP1 gp7 family putative phage head morphogenesis protein